MRLYKIFLVAMSTIFLSSIVSADNHANSNRAAVQTVGCTFDAGKDINDLKSVIAEVNKWWDKNNSSLNYGALLIQPIFSNTATQVSDASIMFFHQNMENLGIAMDQWLLGENGSDKIQSKFESVCSENSQALWSGQALRQPKNNNQNGVIRFQICTLKERANPQRMAVADAEWNAVLDEAGLEGGAMRLWPRSGVSDNVQWGQFVSLRGAGSLAEYGARSDDFREKNLGSKWGMIYGDLYSCNNGVLSSFEGVHSSQQ